MQHNQGVYFKTVKVIVQELLRLCITNIFFKYTVVGTLKSVTVYFLIKMELFLKSKLCSLVAQNWSPHNRQQLLQQLSSSHCF